jgi:hypothetical protein
MPDIQWADYGLAGLAIALVVLLIIKLPDILTASKRSRGEDSKPSQSSLQATVDLRELLENNTKALNELTQFLKTQSEVNLEKEKQSNKQLDMIEAKLDKLLDLQTTHMVKCEAKCQC